MRQHTVRILSVALLVVSPLALAEESNPAQDRATGEIKKLGGSVVLRGIAGGREPYWPQFRGPNGSGVALDDKELPVHFGPTKNVLWKMPLPSGNSSPCVWADLIFLTGFEKEDQKLQTLCIDRNDGQILWRRTAPAEKIEKVHPVGSPAAPTPATDGQRVYSYFGSYGLLCYDFDGNEKWIYPLDTPGTRGWGTGTSPIVAGDLVLLSYAQYREFGSSSLLAVNRWTGETVWKSPRFGQGWSTPMVWSHDEFEEIVMFDSGQLVAYDLDGTKRWWVSELPYNTISTPVTGKGLLFAGVTRIGGDPDNPYKLPEFTALIKQHDENKDGQLDVDEVPPDLVILDRGVGLAGKPGGDITLQRWFGANLRPIDRNRDRKIGRNEWGAMAQRMARWNSRLENSLVAVRWGGRGDVTETHVVWTEKRGVAEVASPLHYQGRVYLVKHGGIVSCLEAQSGRACYRGRLGASGNYYSSPVAADGKVFVASGRGVVVVFEAGDALNVLARSDLGEPIIATPAIVDGKLYVRTEGHLYAFGK